MFDLDCAEALVRFIGRDSWLFVTSLSFEDRCLGFPSLAAGRGMTPAAALSLFPVDNGSRWERECWDKQWNNGLTMQRAANWPMWHVTVDLVMGDPSAEALDGFNSLLQLNAAPSMVI